MTTQLVILKAGSIYMIQNKAKQLWLGPQEPRSKQWGAPGQEVPCWMTTSEASAQAQAALLEANPEPTIWERIADELAKEAQFWRDAKEDPYNIGNAVACSLDSASRSILRGIGLRD